MGFRNVSRLGLGALKFETFELFHSQKSNDYKLIRLNAAIRVWP
jgi:hypothetical protein